MAQELEGLDNVISMLASVADGKKIEKALGKACASVERSAKQKTPKDTGELRRQIASRVENKGATIEGIIFNPLEYAPYVEYGTGLFAENGGRKDVPWAYKDEKTGELIFTKGQHPQPFLRPALHENREKILELIKGGLHND